MSTDPQNPYAAPVSDPIPETSPILGTQLAPLGARFVGALVDSLIIFVIFFPLAFALSFVLSISGVAVHSTLVSSASTIVVGLIGFAVFLGINWKSLNATGQTIGKKVAKTRIVTLQDEKPIIADLIKRYAFYNLVGIIPFVGWIVSLVNVLYVFKSDRRCIHDIVAKTKVVQATV